MPDLDTDALLREAVDETIAGLGEVVATKSGNVVEYRRGSKLFAVLERGAVELRLRPDIAEAVLRTPETAASRRGPDWIRFTPGQVDQFVVDRVEAWLTAAWRTA